MQDNFDFGNDPMEGKEVGTKGIIVSHESLGPEEHRFDSLADASYAVNRTINAMGGHMVDIYPDIYGDIWALEKATNAEPYKIGYSER